MHIMHTQTNSSIPRLGFSLAEVEIATSLSRATLYRAIASGQLKTVKRGKRRLVPAQALEDFLQAPDEDPANQAAGVSVSVNS